MSKVEDAKRRVTNRVKPITGEIDSRIKQLKVMIDSCQTYDDCSPHVVELYNLFQEISDSDSTTKQVYNEQLVAIELIVKRLYNKHDSERLESIVHSLYTPGLSSVSEMVLLSDFKRIVSMIDFDDVYHGSEYIRSIRRKFQHRVV